MTDLKAVVLMLLNDEEVIIEDDLGNYYEVKLEKILHGVTSRGETTLIIHSQSLKG